MVMKAKIAWVPWSPDPLWPTNLRRFSAFARVAGIPYEVYDSQKKYDLIIMNQCSDLTHWSRFEKNGQKIIFETVDSYLDLEYRDLRALFRAPAKYLFGHHRYWGLDYEEQIRAMMRQADAVVCSTPEQASKYVAYNPKVFDILDFNTQQVSLQKNNYFLRDTVHIAWEGMGGNAWAFQEIAPVLKRIHRKLPLALHLVTDLSFKSHNGPLSVNHALKPRLQKIFGDVPFYLYEWNAAMLAPICTRCDIALLPIPKNPPIYWAKPENRLLMLWNMGLPVLTSPTPAYERCMRDAGSEQTCDTLEEWEKKLMALIGDEDLRRESAFRGKAYASHAVSEETLCAKWTAALEQVL